MKTILLLLAFVAVSLARPQTQRFVDARNSRITKSNSERTDRGYKYWVEQDDGQVKQEVAEIVNEGKENESLAVQGFYSYVGDDGKTYSVGYTADENGFQPEGEHIPPAASVKRTPPLGIPSAALASLAG